MKILVSMTLPKGSLVGLRLLSLIMNLKHGSRNADIERRLLSDEVLQIIAYRAMLAFKSVLQHGDLTLPTSVKEATDAYLAENDPIGEFVKWYMAEDYHLTYMLATEFYEKFKTWCKSNYLSGLNISDKDFRKGIIQHKFSFTSGSKAGVEDVYVYTPDYVKGGEFNPNIAWYDCAYCSHCGNSAFECMGCIKKQLFDMKDDVIDVPKLLQEFWDHLPDKDKLRIPKSEFKFDIE